MKLITLLCGLTLATTGLSVQAAELSAADQAVVDAQLAEDCQDEANKDNDECLLLPPVEEATNFIFGLAPLLPVAAAAGLIAAAAGSGGAGGSGIGIGTSTPNTNQ